MKPFEPLKPFEPIKPFEPLKPFEPPKSFELAKQIEASKPPQQTTQSLPEIITTTESTSNNTSAFKNEKADGGLPVGYEPVIALEPLDLNALNAPPPPPPEPIQQNKETKTKAEIEEGKAKSTLKEIISEIDSFAEKDKDLNDVSSVNVDISKKVSDSNIYELTLKLSYNSSCRCYFVFLFFVHVFLNKSVTEYRYVQGNFGGTFAVMSARTRASSFTCF